MKGTTLFQSAGLPSILLYSLFITLTVATTGARAQTTTNEPAVTADAAAAASPTPPPSEADVVQRRVARARALAAVGKLAAAASELESLRAASADESVRDVTRLLLMWIFVEMPDYPRANALLEETFRERAAARGADAASVAYYALAGQTINSVRAHLERYRTFGINVADADLPAEATSDLDQLRGLLERVVEHAKTMRGEVVAQTTAAAANAKGREATSLLEDAASVRLRLARNEQERTRWQGQVSEARQHLVASETRIASISSVPFSRPTPLPAAASAPASTSTSDAASNTGRGGTAKTSDSRKTSSSERAAKDAGNRSNSAPAASRPAAQAPTTPVSGERRPGAPVAVGSLHNLARQKSAPSYPSIARTARVGGIVTVHLVVNEKGEVESVTRAEGPQQLQNAASDAARRWKFHPTVIDGQPVRVSGYLSFNFSL